jgi:broad specificity phosphatase PhoE
MDLAGVNLGWQVGHRRDLVARHAAGIPRMSESLPTVYLARHGETAGSLTGQHTGLTDPTLTKRGQRTARQLAERLKGLAFGKVLPSPLQRALHTCELAGFGAVAGIDPDLVEWGCGKYEGRRTSDIRAEAPRGSCFATSAPGGESPQQVATRVDRVVSRMRSINAEVLFFSSGHFIRVLASHWLGLELSANATYFMLSTASLSALGYEDDLSRLVVRLWNDTHHVAA